MADVSEHDLHSVVTATALLAKALYAIIGADPNSGASPNQPAPDAIDEAVSILTEVVARKTPGGT